MNHRITASTAESFAGVSRATLMRFAEAGYFTVEMDESGSPLFIKKELSDLFNIPFDEAENQEKPVNQAETRTINTISDEVGRCDADYASAAAKQNIADVSQHEESDSVQETDSFHAYEEEITITPAEPEPVLEPEEDFAADAAAQQAASDGELNQAKELKTLANTIKKLKRVVELQEQLLDSREDEIRDLRQQREWLQRRVEKSEEKGERDQLLLISEMQMLTKLVAEQSNKRSPVVAALEWLGIKDPVPTQTGTMIDYRVLKDSRGQQNRNTTDTKADRDRDQAA